MTNTPPLQKVAASVEQGQMAFIQYCQPSLEDGLYELHVEHTLEHPNLKDKSPIADTFHARRKFAVRGERFQLNQAEIYACFPPRSMQGYFHTTVPHAVLKNPMFPWQRSAGNTELSKNGDLTPWVALLLFDEEEWPSIHVQHLTAAQIESRGTQVQGQKILTYPQLATLTEEELQTPCTVIDIPATLLSRIAPAQTELHYLAHVRRVNVADKTDQHLEQAQKAKPSHEGSTLPMTPLTLYDDFSVVVGNRLPQPGKKSIVHLVSLEQCENYLPVVDSNHHYHPNPALTDLDKTSIRLVSLTSWEFTVLEDADDFQSTLKKLDRQPTSLHIPYQIPQQVNQKESEEQIENALVMGYAPIHHDMRYGNKTVSWYRGPLTPFAIEPENAEALLYADQAIRYDPTTGMFDISYAAAWELGRLLAISDKSFAQHLYRWKHRKMIHTVNAIHHEQLLPMLKNQPLPSTSHHDGLLLEQTALELLPSLIAYLQTTGPKEN